MLSLGWQRRHIQSRKLEFLVGRIQLCLRAVPRRPSSRKISLEGRVKRDAVTVYRLLTDGRFKSIWKKKGRDLTWLLIKREIKSTSLSFVSVVFAAIKHCKCQRFSQLLLIYSQESQDNTPLFTHPHVKHILFSLSLMQTGDIKGPIMCKLHLNTIFQQ